MKVKLSADNRLAMYSVLPFHGEDINRKIIEDFRSLIGFSEEDLAHWHQIEKVEYTIGPILKGIIETELTRLHDDELLNPEQLKLYEKFFDI